MEERGSRIPEASAFQRLYTGKSMAKEKTAEYTGETAAVDDIEEWDIKMCWSCTEYSRWMVER
jgi:hypothetical protein